MTLALEANVEHAYDTPDIGPREFLLAVLHDPTVDPYLRNDAAAKLKQYDLLLASRHTRSVKKHFNDGPRRPLDYQPKRSGKAPASSSPKSRRSRSKERELISRNDWLYLKYARDTDAAALRLRDRVLVRNPTFTDNATGNTHSQSNYGGPSA
jgi:hypothetical protein